MRIGIFGGTTSRAVDEIIADAKGVEQAGYASFTLPQVFGFDAMGVLAVVGHEVPRLRLMTGVVPTYGRHPLTMAQQALTVQAASKNRFSLGIGLSHQFVIEHMFGLSFEKPVRHMREYLAALMPLLHDGKVSFHGETFNIEAGVDSPDRVAPPVYVAALGEQMLALAGTVADGTMTWMTGPGTLRDHTTPTITPRLKERDDPRPRSSPRSPFALPTIPTRFASAPRESCRSTACSRRTGRCSTGKAQPAPPMSASSVTKRSSKGPCAPSRRPASPNSSRRSWAAKKTTRVRTTC